MQALTRLIFLAGILLAVPALTQADTSLDWKFLKRDKSIQVYEKPSKFEGLMAFKATAVIPANALVLLETILDSASHSSWLPDCEKSVKLVDIASYRDRIYSITATPWPVDDRDIVLERKIVPDVKNGIIRFLFEAVSDPAVPLRANTVRITHMNGSWTLKRLGPALTEVVYFLDVDPGGSIPTSFTNRTNASSVAKTVKNLGKFVSKAGSSYMEKANRNPLWSALGMAREQ